MDFETAKTKIEAGSKVYADIKNKEDGYLDSIAFGTKLDDGVFYKLMKEGVISFSMMVDGIGEFEARAL